MTKTRFKNDPANPGRCLHCGRPGVNSHGGRDGRGACPPLSQADLDSMQHTFRAGDLVDVRCPGGWVRGRFICYRAGAVDEDFQRIDVQQLTGVGGWIGCHPKNVRPASGGRP